MSEPRLWSIVKMRDGISPAVMAIVEDNPHKPVNRFTGQPLTGARTRYIFPADKVDFVIGQTSPEAMARLMGAPRRGVDVPEAGTKGRYKWSGHTAIKMMTDKPNEARWRVLHFAAPGDIVRVTTSGGRVVDAVFMRVMDQGRRFDFVAEIEGKAWKMGVRALVPPATKEATKDAVETAA